MRGTIEYRDIPGFPGYCVGDDGSVWTLRIGGARPRVRSDWHRLREYGSGENRCVKLRRDGRDHSKTVQACVLSAFRGPVAAGQWCRHKNGNRADNSLTNLRLVPIARCRRRGSRHGMAVLTERAILAIFRERAAGKSHQKIAEAHGVSEFTVRCVLKRTTWRHVEVPSELMELAKFTRRPQ